MIYFELGTSAIIREGMERATAQECMMVGRLIGTEIVGTIGLAFGGYHGMATGSFYGGIGGSFFGKAACSQVIKISSEKAVQKVSERYVSNGKDLKDTEIDIKYISEHVNNASKNKKTSGFNPANAIKKESDGGKLTLKGRVSKDMYAENNNNNLTNTAQYNDSNIKQVNVLKKSISDAIENNSSDNVRFDVDKDYSDYVNEVIDSNKIFTIEDIEEMSEEEIKKNKKAIDFQKTSIGIPSAKQAKASGMVYVSGYTRGDGTVVAAYYRARPQR